MVFPDIEGIRLYKLLFKNYNEDMGAGLVGICGAPGSVKTGACLDIAEKKMENNPREIVFWRETYNSPIQCSRITEYPVKYFVEKGLKLQFINTNRKEIIHPDITVFNDLNELYGLAESQTLNVPFFDSEKKWTELINFCNSDIQAAGDWQSIFIDEMEGLYYEGSNNQTEDRWWDFMRNSGEVVKECRKSLTFLIGNFHDENLIDHRIRGKFQYTLYGFGAIPIKKTTRVYQNKIDQCKHGEFWISNRRHRFGYINIVKQFPPSIERVIIKKL